jgi:L-ascorbate metabolism protein UlaG (beta-lactamase superfamily)
MSGFRLTHIGGQTVLIEIDGWRLLTDPTFDPAGGNYNFGWGAHSEKLEDPAISVEELGKVDAVLLSHEHHEDNLDQAGRDLLPQVGKVITTLSGAQDLDGGVVATGLAPWDSTILEDSGKPTITITATPCRHGPPLSHPITGDVIGFSLEWDGRQGSLWITGDTVLYGGVMEVADRIDVDTALVHLGGVKFPISGPLKYTMDAADAVELCEKVAPNTLVPIHFEGWKHFREGKPGIDAEFARAPQRFRDTVRWLEPGAVADFD